MPLSLKQEPNFFELGIVYDYLSRKETTKRPLAIQPTHQKAD